jgi:uncharacterized protein (DUF427 family)/acyl-CoA thioesterase
VTKVESAWGTYPDYEINLVPCGATARVWHGDTLVAESTRALRVEETAHVDRLYIPDDDVRWEHFTPTDHTTICPFKGEATYWTLHTAEPSEDNVVWAYPTPFAEVGGIVGHVGFYHERLRIELEEEWPAPRPARPVTRFPAWGDASDLLALLDVAPSGPGPYGGAPYRDVSRNGVEGGQLLGQAIVAASKTIPGQQVTSASMIFSKAASFDAPLDLDVEVLRGGRSFSTVEVRVSQADKLRSAALLLLDAGADPVVTGNVAMPDVAGPDDAEPFDFRVTGRELRVVDGAYPPDPDRIGPPEINTWVRFRDAPDEPYLHTALMAQSTTHWTIAAAMLPHAGISEAQAHVSLSTGVLAVTLAVHDQVDVTEWLLYSNPAISAARGLAQGEGHVFTRDGRLVASYTVQAMIRPFARDPAAMGKDATDAM